MAIIKPKIQNNTSVVEDENIITPEINILHMYPEDMNIYGDYGNIISLKKRCLWRAIQVKVYNLNLSGVITDEQGIQVKEKSISDFDIYFMGGGQDADQADVYKDLLNYKSDIKNLVENNKVFLLICGGYQLFGKSFLTIGGKEIDGLGVLDVDTVGGDIRCIGNIIVESNISELKGIKFVGFENHSGRTRILSNKVNTFGKVLHGIGNAESGNQEGGIYKNVYGCYIHGSFLPKNPEFSDMFIKKALDNKYGENKVKLIEIDDYIEKLARDRIIKKFLKPA